MQLLLIAMVLFTLTILLTSLAIVREREQGTIEQLMVTPIKPIELIVGKVIPYVAVAFFGVLEVLALGVFWFGVPVHGSVSLLLLLSDASPDASPSCAGTDDTLDLEALTRAVPRRRFVAGEHDFESWNLDEPAVSFERGRIWRDWLGEDVSGEVDYQTVFNIPAAWEGGPLQLETGEIEYAATVFLDGAVVGQMAWPPWRLSLPPCSAGRHELVIRVANTLANELTSDRVAREWAAKSGCGWPGAYHQRALEFERKTKGGGLRGPLLLRRLGRD